MKPTDRQGLFEVIDSFAIRNRKQFYIIGKIKEGKIKENWFINILFESLTMTIRINSIEEVEMASDKETYKLLIFDCDESDDITINFYMGLDLKLEYLPITIEGED